MSFEKFEAAQYRSPNQGEVADPTKVGGVDDANQNGESTEKSGTKLDKNKGPSAIDLMNQQKLAREKGSEIAMATQAPALNPDATQAAELGLQQEEALRRTFP